MAFDGKRRRTTPLRDRVFAKLEIQPDGCLVWQGCLTPAGYGQVGRGRRGEGQATVHRLTYEWFAGPIPTGLELDHLCRNRACANVAHLEPVSRRENLLRGETIPAVHAAKTHCIRGHAFDEDNTYRRPGFNGRQCRACHKAWKEAHRGV